MLFPSTQDYASVCRFVNIDYPQSHIDASLRRDYGRDTIRLASHVPSANAKPATNAAIANARYDVPVHDMRISR